MPSPFPKACRTDSADPGKGGGRAGDAKRTRMPMPPGIYVTPAQSLSVTSVDLLAFQANNDRRLLIIQNQSGVDWVIAFDSKAKTGFGLIIPAGGTREFDSFTLPRSEIHLIAYAGIGPYLGVGIEGFV